MALGQPCHTLLLWSVCSRSGNCCECTRTLQHVTLPGDTVENPSSKRLVVCWRLRQRRSISSCWHSPAFVHHIWPRWKLSQAQVSFPTWPSTMPSWQPRSAMAPEPGTMLLRGLGHQGGTRGSSGLLQGPDGWRCEVGRGPERAQACAHAGCPWRALALRLLPWQL